MELPPVMDNRGRRAMVAGRWRRTGAVAHTALNRGAPAIACGTPSPLARHYRRAVLQAGVVNRAPITAVGRPPSPHARGCPSPAATPSALRELPATTAIASTAIASTAIATASATIATTTIASTATATNRCARTKPGPRRRSPTVRARASGRLGRQAGGGRAQADAGR